MIGNNDPVSPARRSQPRILRIEDPLEYQRPLPALPNKLEIPPAHGRIKVAAHPREKIFQSRLLAEHRCDVAEMMGPAEQTHIPCPLWTRHRLEYPTNPTERTTGPREPRPIVAVTRPRHG